MYKKNDYVAFGKSGDVVSFDYQKGIKVHDKVYKTFDKKLRDALYDCFYDYLLPINNLDNDIWRYHW